MTAARRARVLLALGAAAGLAAAAVDLLRRPGADALPPGAVASVNGEPVRTEELARALAALASDRRTPPDAGERRRVLDRLIDEELLLQHALALGLVRRDRVARADLVSAAIDVIVAEASAREPTEAEIEAFHREQRDYFARPGRFRVRQVLVGASNGDPPDDARAGEAVRRLRAGEAFATVRADLGDREVAPLPDALVPATTLQHYLGATATRAVLDLEPGAVSDPVRSAAGLHVLQVVEREPEDVPPLAEIHDEVRAELRRRTSEHALRARLDDLRRRAAIRTVDTLP